MANSLMGMMGGAPAVQAPLRNIPDMGAIKEIAQSAKRMMGVLQTVKDPQKALEMVAQQNPQLNAVMQMCNGKNPQQVFYEECQKQGIDPNIILNELRG